MNVNKILRRFSLISISAAYNLVPIFFNMVAAALVVRLLNADLWGAMVQAFLWTGVAGNVMAWGNKDFLIRSFSTSPTTLYASWQKSFGSRSAIFTIVIIVLLFLPLAFILKCWIAVFIMARFIYMSYDSVIVFKRKFWLIIVLETLGFILICSAIFLLHPDFLLQLLPWFVIAELLKTAGVVTYFRREIVPLFFKSFDHRYFTLAFSFFILYFSGMLASRVDLLCVTAFFTKDDIARYQVLISFLQMTQVMIPILLLPFIAGIYRLNITSVRKISLRLFMLGIFISAVAVVAIDVVVGLLYHFHYDYHVFLFGWLMIVPGFYYSPIIYRMFKSNRQKIVVLISVLFIFCCAAFIFLFVNLFVDQVAAVIAAVAAAQWIQGIIYFFIGRSIA